MFGLFLAAIICILPFFMEKFIFIETPQDEIAFTVGSFVVGIIIIIISGLF